MSEVPLGQSFTYVDNSNVFIEGSRVSAVNLGLEGATSIAEASRNKVVDRDWQLDYGRLHQFVCGNKPETIGGAFLWGSPPPGDSFWEMVKRHGFEVEKFDRNIAGKEKKVDVAIAYRMTKDAYSGKIDKENDEITLVAGDKDFVPVVEGLTKAGFRVDVVFWNHASAEIKTVASRFINLNPHLQFISRK